MTRIAGWLATEPVRAYLGGLLIALVALLVGYGVLTGEQAALWFAFGTAALGFPAVSKARSRVRPVYDRDNQRGAVDVVSVLAIVVLVLAILWLLGVLPR